MASLSQIVDVFRQCDAKGEGIITRSTLSNLLRRLDSDTFVDTSIDLLLGSVKHNSDGTISYKDFVEWVMAGECCSVEGSLAVVPIAGEEIVPATERQVAVPPATTDRLREIFDQVDIDGSGHINKRELIKTLRTQQEVAEFLGLPTTVRQEDGSRTAVEVFFQGVDRNDDRSISWEEFCDFCLPQLAKARDEALALEASAAALSGPAAALPAPEDAAAAPLLALAAPALPDPVCQAAFDGDILSLRKLVDAEGKSALTRDGHVEVSGQVVGLWNMESNCLQVKSVQEAPLPKAANALQYAAFAGKAEVLRFLVEDMAMDREVVGDLGCAASAITVCHRLDLDGNVVEDEAGATGFLEEQEVPLPAQRLQRAATMRRSTEESEGQPTSA
mmetsp:Transcript_48262/g.103483  ORF Transcript_48262/g.103483 Transcript_48262/m.103483 type:complete len:389 (+) Transcript_48262:58-1224(+)